MQAANKNPPWARSAGGNMDGLNSTGTGGAGGMIQYGGAAGGAMYGQGMMANAGSNMMGMQAALPMGQMAAGGIYPGNVVAYPTPRAINTGAFSQATPAATEQRVFTGTVTKTHNDFGFVDHDVFYQTSVCAKGMLPKVNDRVLVEATYNANMPFKWNATRVQVLTNKTTNSGGGGGGSGYNAVPPPSGGAARDSDRFRKSPTRSRKDNRSPRRSVAPKRPRSKTPRARTPKRRDSPPRKRAQRRSPTPPAKYSVRVPRMPLDVSELDVTSMNQRYANLYIPSDFFYSAVRWGEAFPPQYPFTLHNSCQYHLMNKDVPNPLPNDAVLEPPDADYRFSAKVMLISLPSLEVLYQKCGLTKSDNKDKWKGVLHPTRLIKFLVGHKGKTGESFAIGGPWSPSLDGPNPEKDPSVLVKTAIRTTKALTGIDLSPCTQWFRMVEFYYWREGGGGGAPGERKARLETVVLFLPDVWTAAPSCDAWAGIQQAYKLALEKQLNPPPEPVVQLDTSRIDSSDAEVTLVESGEEEGPKKEPTHHSQLDLKTIKVDQLREELDARGLNNKGLRAQLLARLTKAVKTEEENEIKKKEEEEAAVAAAATAAEEEKKEEKSEEVVEIKDDAKDQEKEVTSHLDEKQIAQLRSRYELPSAPHLVVHPSTTARGGKFNCTLSTLSVLLDYRSSDNKEHSFEIFVFAELFNEMLQRDFGFYIYKTLYTLPEKEEEKKDNKKSDKDSKKSDDKDKKTDDKDKKEENKENKEEKKKDENKKEEKTEDNKEDNKREDSKDKDKKKSRESVESEVTTRHGRGVELPPDPYLLLALVYFDTTRGASLLRRDLQTLFMSLGLHLSRSQLKQLLDKVCVKDNFTYKSLMSQIRDLASSAGKQALQDLPLDSTVTSATSTLAPVVVELEALIASGNRDLLPVFDDGSGGGGGGGDGGDDTQTTVRTDSGMVMYKKRLVDIGATLAALSRAERASTVLEGTLAETRAALRTACARAEQHASAAGSFEAKLGDTSAELASTKAKLGALNVKLNLFHSTLKTIQVQVDGVININLDTEPKPDPELLNGPLKIEKKEEIGETEMADVKEEKADSAQTKSDTISTPAPPHSECDATQADTSDQLQPQNMEIDDK